MNFKAFRQIILTKYRFTQMKILVINCGSSSIKYKLYEMDDKSVLAAGGIEKIGLEGSFLKTKINDETKIIESPCPTHTEGIKLMFDTLLHAEYGAIKSLDEISAAGHRIVAGGRFTKSQVVTPEMLEEWRQYMDLAPLHSPAHLKGYEAVRNMLPNLPQVFVFDTAFHQTMPAHAYMYALPYEYYEKYGVRRYGFHGTSHRYVSRRACEFLGLDYENTKVITAHIGGGGSITAVKNGKSIDTSMGLTPVEGLVMGTRCGDVDLGAMTYLMEKEGLDAAGVNAVINKKSGVMGVSGVSSDMRDIEAAIAAGNERAKLALDMFEYRLLKYIGAYTAALNGVDVLVFTGGIGENQMQTRDYICRGLEYLGVKYDAELNGKTRGEEIEISTPDSKVRVVVIPTDEELTIASDTVALIKN